MSAAVGVLQRVALAVVLLLAGGVLASLLADGLAPTSEVGLRCATEG